MKKYNKRTLMALSISLLLLIAANNVYCAVNPPMEGSHWRGPAVLVDITLVPGQDDEFGEPTVDVYYIGSCKGIEVVGDVNKPGDFYTITNKDQLLYFDVNIPDCRPDNVYGKLMVSNVIEFDDSQRSNGIITAKVILLYSVGK